MIDSIIDYADVKVNLPATQLNANKSANSN